MEEAGPRTRSASSPPTTPLLIWGLDPVTDPAALFDPDRLRDGLEGWLGGNAVMKRTFRTAAIIAGLIERNHQGRRKTGRQATFSSDILYDTLRKYDPGHLMLQITREEAGARPRRFRPHRGDARPQSTAASTLSACPASPRSPPRCSSNWAASRSRAPGASA